MDSALHTSIWTIVMLNLNGPMILVPEAPGKEKVGLGLQSCLSPLEITNGHIVSLNGTLAL
jgi:hypothetical protein